MNDKTVDTYGKMANSHRGAVEYLAMLQDQRRQIDAKILDITRVILGFQSMLSVLEPALPDNEPEMDAGLAHAVHNSLMADEKAAA
jgi:hypothetical protein